MKFIIFLLAFISLPILAEKQEIKQESKWHEADYVDHHCKGEIEYVLSDMTRIDCLSKTHAVEYDWGKKWAEAIGQSLYYSAMTGKKAGIVLITSPRTKHRYLTRLKKAIEAHELNIDVWTVDKKQE